MPDRPSPADLCPPADPDDLELAELHGEPDVIFAARDPHGRLVTTTRLATGYRLTRRAADGTPGTWDEAWDYPPAMYDPPHAAYWFAGIGMVALIKGEEDPGTWYRHRPSNRRRPFGDPTREVIAP